MSKVEELRKKAAKLKDEARKIEAQAKAVEEEAFTKLGMLTAKFLAGAITLDELEEKAVELEFAIQKTSGSLEDDQ